MEGEEERRDKEGGKTRSIEDPYVSARASPNLSLASRAVCGTTLSFVYRSGPLGTVRNSWRIVWQHWPHSSES